MNSTLVSSCAGGIVICISSARRPSLQGVRVRRLRLKDSVTRAAPSPSGIISFAHPHIFCIATFSRARR